MTRRILALVMALAILATLSVGAYAATVPNATIDPNAKGSMTIYKYDFTQADLDGNTTVGGTALKDYLEAYASDGLDNAALREAMTNPSATDAPGSENPTGKPLGNGQTSNGYAIKGVEFSYLKVGNIVQYTETETAGTHKVMVLYEMDDVQDAALLTALGLTNSDAYPVESHVDAGSGDNEFTPVAGKHYFEPDTLINALRSALNSNATSVKAALEAYMAAQNAAKFAETDANGYTKVDNLDLGLYLVVETKVPEMVTATVAPFFVQVPMTTINGTVANNGGEEWLYDITMFPKNEAGIPSLEKTVREANADTGKNNGSEAANDGYAHNATASAGDVVQYQWIAQFPEFTSPATYLTLWGFEDVLSKGIEYNGNPTANTANLLNGHFNANDVKIEIYKDEACTDKVTTWTLEDATPKYTVDYDPPVEAGENAPANDATCMQVMMTGAGLEEINQTGTYTGRPALESGYSRLYMRVTYSATLNQNADLVVGDEGNPNTVSLKWQRTNMSYYDTLTDDAHVYSYELDLTKTFDDAQGDPTKVQFKLFNATDGYWVNAIQNPENSGIYYVNGHTAGTADEDGSKGTTFIPASTGLLKIIGLEDDEYIMTETVTDNGYNRLAEDIHFVIKAEDDATRPCNIYTMDENGVWQNKYTGEKYNGTPYDQDQMAHNMLTASATVDGSPVTMLASGASTNAIVPWKVVNYHVPDLPVTGEQAQTYFMIGAGILLAAAAVILFFALKKRKAEDQ